MSAGRRKKFSLQEAVRLVMTDWDGFSSSDSDELSDLESEEELAVRVEKKPAPAKSKQTSQR